MCTFACNILEDEQFCEMKLYEYWREGRLFHQVKAIKSRPCVKICPYYLASSFSENASLLSLYYACSDVCHKEKNRRYCVWTLEEQLLANDLSYLFSVQGLFNTQRNVVWSLYWSFQPDVTQTIFIQFIELFEFGTLKLNLCFFLLVYKCISISSYLACKSLSTVCLFYIYSEAYSYTHIPFVYISLSITFSSLNHSQDG